MNRVKLSLAAVAAVIGVSAGTLVLAALPAVAAGCKAQPFSSCVAVNYQTASVKSIRVNGRCLIGSSGKYSGVTIDSQEVPFVQTYGGTKCEGNTEKRVRVNIGGDDAQRYRWITIS